MMKHSLAARLSALYATLLGITVVVVILASSIALVVQLTKLISPESLIAEHQEARNIAQQYRFMGKSLAQAAPQIVRELSNFGLRIAVYDRQGRLLGGDPTLRPRSLDRVIAGQLQIPPPSALASPGGRTIDPLSLTAVDGGYVAFAPPTLTLLLVTLVPYWRVVLTIAIIAILLSWFVGRLFASHALQPLNDVADSLRSLADGDFTRRRFATIAGDEIGALTQAYNDAVASVAAALDDRRDTEARMRRFIADAGHELRTPLTVLSGYIDVLRRGALDEPRIARQILGTMSIEKEHMRGLIDRLMRLARLDAEPPVNVEPIDVAELLRSQCDAARRLDETRTIDYSVDGVRNVLADRIELGEALWNLVENALKYAPDAPIHLHAGASNGHTIITVRDEGPGMSEHERLHAFERFYRGDQRGEITGSGLGLAIAKRAVERAGGSIAIDSAPGHGTAVSITL